jgi:hypothetical protein
MSGLLENWHDARIKLAVTTLVLDLRRMREKLFATGWRTGRSFKGSSVWRI